MRCIERAFDASAVMEATDDGCCRNGIVLTPAAAEAAATDDEVVSRELLEPTAAGALRPVLLESIAHCWRPGGNARCSTRRVTSITTYRISTVRLLLLWAS